MQKLLLPLLLAVLCAQLVASEKAVMYFFWGDGCPHCAAAKPFIADMEAKHPELEVKRYEVWHNSTNAALFQRMAALYNTKPSGVPTFFIGGEVLTGYDEEYRKVELESLIKKCIQRGCPDPLANNTSQNSTITPPQAPNETSGNSYISNMLVLSNEQGKGLVLLGGAIVLVLGIILIANPFRS